MKEKALPFLIIIFGLAGCETPHHAIRGTTYGWDAAMVTVIADIEINSLQVRHIKLKNDSCKSGYSHVIELSGPIGPDSSEVVERMLSQLPQCEDASGVYKHLSQSVYLNSNGGSLIDGFRMGQMLRRFQVATVVTGGQICASACATAFLGGTHRTIKHDGKLAFHAPYYSDGKAIYCQSKQNAQDLKRYLATFLRPNDAEYLFERTMAFCGRDEVWVINADAARLFGITTD